MKSVPYYCQTLLKIEYSKYVFGKKASNIKFMNIYPIGAKLFRANRHIDIQRGRQIGGSTDVLFGILQKRLINITMTSPRAPLFGHRSQQYVI